MKSVFELAALASLLALGLGSCRSSPGHEDVSARPFRCANCHAAEARTTTHPPHLGVRPEACGVCHSQSSWEGARIDHPFWELTGSHARAAADRSLAGKEQRVKCFWCHRGEPAQFAGTPRECIGCHAEDRQGVRFPEHDSFSDDCASCHSTEAWKPAKRPKLAPAESLSVPSASSSAPPSKAVPKPRTPASRSPKPVTPTVTPPPTPTVTPTPVPTVAPTSTPSPLPRIPDITSQASHHRR